ncbi:MAG TPA: F0F1 ATP synthase subunit epsilon [Methylomirabilota bacterium]|nr:F0F1 ATP synthase subunit epsilon [Methylomirabilota bacterium]
MLPDSFELIVVTPEKQLLHERAVAAQLPGAGGELGILPGHAPLITELGVGELSYTGGDSRQTGALAIARGFAEVLPDRVTILAETGERAEDIDVARAGAALQRAEKRLASPEADMDWDRATIALQRALIRIQVARKRSSARVSTP